MSAPKVRHLTTAELAEREGVPVATVKKWRAIGDGPPFMRVGKFIRYRERDVEAWEKTRLVTTA